MECRSYIIDLICSPTHCRRTCQFRQSNILSCRFFFICFGCIFSIRSNNGIGSIPVCSCATQTYIESTTIRVNQCTVHINGIYTETDDIVDYIASINRNLSRSAFYNLIQTSICVTIPCIDFRRSGFNSVSCIQSYIHTFDLIRRFQVSVSCITYCIN